MNIVRCSDHIPEHSFTITNEDKRKDNYIELSNDLKYDIIIKRI